MTPEKINIKIIKQTISEHDSDRGLFALFDFLLIDKQQCEEKEITDFLKENKI